MSGETSPENPLTVALFFSPLTETPLPCGANTLAYWAQYQVTQGSTIHGAVYELLLALDSQPLGLVENLAHSLADLGVTLVPIPLAPPRSGFPPANEAENRTWSMPDRAVQQTRAEEVLKRQMAGYLALHGYPDDWTLADQPIGQPDMELVQKVLSCLNQAFLPRSLGTISPHFLAKPFV